MSVSLSRNLKLRIDSNLTANAKYNLERIDLLGASLLPDSTNTLNLKSQSDIVIEAESTDVGGSGIGGTVSIGTTNHLLENIDLWADVINIPVALGLKDQGTSGTKSLKIKYNSTLSGAVDTSSDRTLSVDLEGSDRSLILGGSLGLLGGDLTLTLSGASSITLPQSGTLSTLSGTETLTNKSMDALSNTFTNLASAVFPTQSGNSGKFLQTDGSVTSWVTVGGVSGVATNTGTWTTGTSFPFNHGLGTSDIVVSVIDDQNDIIYVDVDVTDSNNITVTSSEAPTGSWRVVVHG